MKSSIWIIVTFLVGLVAGMMLPSSDSQPQTPSAADKATASTKITSSPSGLNGPAEISLPDPFACWQKMMANQPHGTAESREDLLKRMAQLDPEQAWRTLSALKGGMKSQDVKIIAKAWADKDAQKAAAFGMSLKDPLLRPAFLTGALSHWAVKDIQGFHSWLSSQPANLDLTRYLDLSYLRQDWVNPSLSGLALLAKIDPPGEEFPKQFGQVVYHLWRKPEERANVTAWLRQLEDPLLRDAAWLEIAKGSVRSDPAGAAALLPEVTDLKRNRELSSNVAAHMASSQPREALAFALNLQHELARQGAWESAFSTWLHRDPVAALGAVQKDIPLEWLAYSAPSLGQFAPQESIEVIQSLPGPESQRAEVLGELVTAWKRQQPASAARWLASDAAQILPEQKRQGLISPPKTVSSSWLGQGKGTRTRTINGRSVSYVY